MLAFGAVVVPTAPATAVPAITFDGSPGAASPPSSLGPYTMTSFGLDARPLFTDVTDVADAAGTISFSVPMSHRRVGSGWATWSHGYTGDVYRSGSARSVTITMPESTLAFYVYVEPAPFDFVEITARAQDGTTSGPMWVDGWSGASYFGFYGTGGGSIESVTISASTEFGIGEFGIARGSAPDCSQVQADATKLWPPSGKLQLVNVVDASDQQLGVNVVSVDQDEPRLTAKGESQPAAVLGDEAGSVWLRAHRNGSGDGRVYRIAYTGSNTSGVQCEGTVVVGVPRDMSASAVDSLESFDALASS